MPRPVRLLALLALLASTAGLAQAAPETYQVDATHSSVHFRIKHLDVGYVYGRFNQIAGSIVLDEQSPAATKVEMTIQVTSVDTNDAKRDQHLRSPDFFNVAQFPTMTFQSTSAQKADGAWQVTGNLTLHGVTKSVTLRMEETGSGNDPWGGFRRGYEGRFTIRRSEFGMTNMMEAVGDEVTVMIAVEAVRK